MSKTLYSTDDRSSCGYVVCDQTTISRSGGRIDSVKEVDMFSSVEELVHKFGGIFDLVGADEGGERVVGELSGHNCNDMSDEGVDEILL